jgi:hypothetical protein
MDIPDGSGNILRWAGPDDLEEKAGIPERISDLVSGRKRASWPETPVLPVCGL